MLSTRVFVVETAEDRSSEFMGRLAELQDAGLVVDWGCVVPVSLAEDDADAIADAYKAATEGQADGA